MHKCLYFLVHQHTGERCFRPYKTLTGARIAQRSRNRSLGFVERIERTSIGDNWEAEQCRVEGRIETATYFIVEYTVDSNEQDLLLG
jgi:hypothetical protein